jgi:hypothetical protein
MPCILQVLGRSDFSDTSPSAQWLTPRASPPLSVASLYNVQLSLLIQWMYILISSLVLICVSLIFNCLVRYFSRK